MTTATQSKRGQVVDEGSECRPLVSRIHDAADEERKSAMRGFYFQAAKAGLDCTARASERMRRELSYALGRWIYSRAEVSTGEFLNLQALVEIGRLAW